MSCIPEAWHVALTQVFLRLLLPCALQVVEVVSFACDPFKEA